MKRLFTILSTAGETRAFNIVELVNLFRVQAGRGVSRPPVTGWRRWVGRLALMLLVPAVLLGTLELGLRLSGYGYSTSFFQKMEDGLNYTANRCFGWQFFRRETSTYPHPF